MVLKRAREEMTDAIDVDVDKALFLLYYEITVHSVGVIVSISKKQYMYLREMIRTQTCNCYRKYQTDD